MIREIFGMALLVAVAVLSLTIDKRIAEGAAVFKRPNVDVVLDERKFIAPKE